MQAFKCTSSLGHNSVGGCFAYTVTGIAGATEQIVLPFSVPVPANAVYRKLVNGEWFSFDESGVDTVESAPGAQRDCAAATAYAPGQNQGYFCVRLTIADGGPNDDDGRPGDLTDADGSIIDPGGVGVLTPSASDNGGGCSIAAKTPELMDKLDWFIVFAFIALSGFVRKIRKKQGI